MVSDTNEDISKFLSRLELWKRQVCSHFAPLVLLDYLMLRNGQLMDALVFFRLGIEIR
jgi:hypothetical protein